MFVCILLFRADSGPSWLQTRGLQDSDERAASPSGQPRIQVIPQENHHTADRAVVPPGGHSGINNRPATLQLDKDTESSMKGSFIAIVGTKTDNRHGQRASSVGPEVPGMSHLNPAEIRAPRAKSVGADPAQGPGSGSAGIVNSTNPQRDYHKDFSHVQIVNPTSGLQSFNSPLNQHKPSKETN